MTEDIQNSSFDKKAIDMIATTIQHDSSLTDLDSMFLEAEENLSSISQSLTINPLLREKAFELYEKMCNAQKEYDKYFIVGRVTEEEIVKVKRPLAYQIAAYQIFIQQNSKILKKAGIFLERKQMENKGLPLIVISEELKIKDSRTPGQKIAETGIWPYR